MLKKYSWSEMPLEKLTPLFSRRMISAEKIMVAHVHLKAGCVVPTHHHHNEQVSYVLNGALRFWVGESVSSPDGAGSLELHAGDVLTIPGNLPHRILALEDTLSVDIFSPPRADWLDGSDAYLRQS